ncbi:hypothetical protein BD779DRAFT_1678697 [Infundibulicybe gibba]|nr:hypothetical protein BD779DRAFT_1678697 [Infundibulicybe gibba]
MDMSISDANDLRIHGYLIFLSLVFLYYDHLITIDREIKYVWRRPKKTSAYLFLANRYFSFLANIVVAVFQVTNFGLLERFEVSLNTELISQMVSSKLQELQSVAAGSPFGKSIPSTPWVALSVPHADFDQMNRRPVLMTLRVFALYEHRLRVLGSMVILGAAVVGVSLWALYGQKTTVAPRSGCHIALLYPTSTRLATGWLALFAYDLVVFALTLAKTWQAGRKIKIHTRLPIIALLLRDGAIYFAVMALADLANIFTFYVCVPTLDPPVVHSSVTLQFCGWFLRGGLSTFSNNISVTMMSRLMLNLHETASTGIFSAHVSRLGPLSEAEFFNENRAISELPSLQEAPGEQPGLRNETE